MVFAGQNSLRIMYASVFPSGGMSSTEFMMLFHYNRRGGKDKELEEEAKERRSGEAEERRREGGEENVERGGETGCL